MDDRQQAICCFAPIAGEGCRTLVLGTMPSIASLEKGEYYGHSRNAFWPIMGSIFGFDAAMPYPRRTQAMQAAGVGIWDVLAQCRRAGSLDADIRDAVPNDISGLLAQYPGIERIVFNGKGAQKLFARHVSPTFNGLCRCATAPSTSPAYTLAFGQKLAAWRDILTK